MSLPRVKRGAAARANAAYAKRTGLVTVNLVTFVARNDLMARKPQDSRTARPEQQFFDDPAVDRLMGTVMALATEVFVLQSRLRGLESRLAESGTVDIDDLRDRGEDPAQQASEAKAYSEHLLRPLLGTQDALGPTD